MISLSDEQLRTVMTAASALDPEKRDTFLQRVAALLQQRAGRFTDLDVANAAEMSLRSITHHHAAA